METGIKLNFYSCYSHRVLAKAYVSSAYLHHFYNKDKETAKRFLIQRSHLPQTGQSRAYWPTSPSEGLCPQLHPQAVCLGSSLVKVSGCPCESPSGIEASLFVPFCERQKRKRHVRWSQRQIDTQVRGIRHK